MKILIGATLLVSAHLLQAQPPAATLDWAFSPNVIGLNPAFIESKLGPPKRKSRNNWTFDVQGCEIIYKVHGDEITSATSPVDSQCQPKVFQTRLNERTTFAQVGGFNTALIMTCLNHCGNASEAVVDLYVSLPCVGCHDYDLLFTAYTWDLEVAERLWKKGNRRSSVDNDCVYTKDESVVKMGNKSRIIYATIGRDLLADYECTFPSL